MTDAELKKHIDGVTQTLFTALESEGALGVVVIVARRRDAVVGCTSDEVLAGAWPAILHRVANTIAAPTAAAVAIARKDRAP